MHRSSSDKKPFSRIRLLISALVAAVFLSGCDVEVPVEESIAGVDKVLEIRKQAIDNKDLALYKTILLPDYSSSGVPYESVIDDIERLFSTDEKIEFIYQKAQPSIAMNSARVTHMIEYKFMPSGKSAKIRETINLRRIESDWFISGGITLGLGM